MSNFIKIRLVGVEFFHANRRTDMTKLTVAFRNFTNAPKNDRKWKISEATLWGNKCVFRHWPTSADVTSRTFPNQVGTEYLYGQIRLYSQGNAVKVRSNALERDWPPYDLTAARVIAQQYSTITYVSLHSHFRKEKFGALFKKVVILLRKSEIT